MCAGDLKDSSHFPDFTGHSVRRLDAAVAELEGRRNRSLVFLVTLLGAGVVAVLGFRAYLGRRIVRPLVAMANTATDIAHEGRVTPVDGGYAFEARVATPEELTPRVSEPRERLVRSGEGWSSVTVD